MAVTASLDRPTLPARADLRAAVIGLLLVAAWDVSGLDVPTVRLFGSGTGFALRDHWLLSVVLHEGTRDLAWVLVGVLVVAALLPRVGALTRRERWGWVAMTLVAAAVVPLVKRHSLTSCPWDLAEFGGHARYVPHWLLGAADGGGGHCFPSGHATSAFVFFSGGFALRRAYPVLARRWQASVLAAGLLLGLVQLVRGAHYPSHTLWSGWLCFVTCALLAPWVAGRTAASSSVAVGPEAAGASSATR